MKKIITLLAIATACLTSCTEDLAKEYSISLESTRLSFDSEGGKQQVSLESTYEWEVSGGDDWCSVSPQSGEGDAEVVFTIDPNMTEDGRSAEFIFTSGNKKTTLTVTQEKKEYSISIEPKELKFGAEGGEQEITVTSSDEWEVKGESDWCEISLTSGNNGDKVTFFADPYENTAEERTTIFTFYCGDKDVDLIVTQEAKEYSISIEPTEIEFEAAGGEQTITVTSSDSWRLTTSSDWIATSTKSGNNGSMVNIAVGYNTSDEIRTGIITFTCGDKTAKFTVTQNPDNSPIIQFKDPYFEMELLKEYDTSIRWNGINYKVNNVDKNGDGRISTAEAAAVKVLLIYDDKVRNVDELKTYFSSLEFLKISECSLESLDLSGHPTLTKIGFAGDPYNFSIDVNLSSCHSLKEITFIAHCSGNYNISDCTALTSLDCHDNQLTSLDVSGCTALTDLRCNDNQLTSLDVSGCTALTDLRCNDNELTSLDVSGCTALTDLHCYDNQLISLDLSNNTALTDLRCNNNELTSLDVSKNTALTELNCVVNQLTSLDVSNNTALTDLDCGWNQLTSLDVSKNTALTELNCVVNQLTSLDVSNNTALTELNFATNQLTSLDVSNNTALTYLGCYANQLTSLDLSNNRKLTNLGCSENQLREIILYKYHMLPDSIINNIKKEYGDIITYTE